MELKHVQEEIQKTWAETKAVLERQEAEIKKYGESSGETKKIVDALNSKITELEDVKKRLADAEVKIQRLPAQDPGGGGGKPSEAKAAFFKWARGWPLTPEERKFLQPAGSEYLPPEMKALSLGDATAAGNLAPIEFVREIIKAEIEFSPLRTVARVRTTSARSIQIPRRSGVFAAAWVAELGTRTETTGLTYVLEELPTHELYALVDASFAQLEDSAFDLETELRAEFAEQFGVAEGAAFVSGNGVGRPEGFTDAAAGLGQVNSGAAAAVTADGVIKLFYALKDAYVRNAVWVMRRATIQDVRLLKDTQNQYLWAPGLQGDQPSQLLGKPIIEALDMPAVAANALAIAFGDFTRGYTILDRIEIAVIRDPFTQAASGKIRFHARKRVGGHTVLADAIKLQKIAV